MQANIVATMLVLILPSGFATYNSPRWGLHVTVIKIKIEIGIKRGGEGEEIFACGKGCWDK